MIYLLHESLDQLLEDMDEQLHDSFELTAAQRQSAADQNMAPTPDRNAIGEVMA